MIKRIAELRVSRGLSQAQLAKSLNLSVKTIKNWESGISDPSAKNIIQLAEVFSVSSDFLLGIESNRTVSLNGLSSQNQELFIAIAEAYIQALEKQQRK
ncbi:MAG: helix-turn-helix transcriptional regulator [Firmicutes bacterium]|nr:helix-turn-helix transcriptional regulator [Bacillota bacterium]